MFKRPVLTKRPAWINNTHHRNRRAICLQLEGLEHKSLLSITFDPTITTSANHFNQATGEIYPSNSTMANPGTESITVQTGELSYSASANGSYSTSLYSLSIDQSTNATINGTGFAQDGVEGRVEVTGRFTLSSRSTLNISQLSRVEDGSRIYTTIYNGPNTGGSIFYASKPADGVNYQTTTTASSGTYSYVIGIYSEVHRRSDIIQHPSNRGSQHLEINFVPANTSITMMPSTPNPSTLGQPVTLTAVITPITGQDTPSGTVTFKDGPNVIGISGLEATGIVTVVTKALKIGNHTISAIYSGDSNFSGGSSASIEQSVIPIVSLEQLHNFLPTLPIGIAQSYIEPLNDSLNEFGIVTPKRIAAFLSQIAVESKDPRTGIPLSQMTQVFNNPPSDTFEIGRGPIQLTHQYNYSDAQAYFRFEQSIVENPTLVAEDLYIGFRTSAWFYSVQSSQLTRALYGFSDLNALADSLVFSGPATLSNPDFLAKATILNNKLTRVINGPGRNALKDRLEYYTRALILFGV